jgi:hypothetical protein
VRHEPAPSAGSAGDDTSDATGSGGASGGTGIVGTQGGSGGGTGDGGTGGGGTGGSNPAPGADGGQVPPRLRIEDGEYALVAEPCRTLGLDCVNVSDCSTQRHGFVLHDGEDLLLVYAGAGDLSALKLWPQGEHFMTNRSVVLTRSTEEAWQNPATNLAGPFEVWFGDADANGSADTVRLEGSSTCYHAGSSDPEASLTLTGTIAPAPAIPTFEAHGDGWYEPVTLTSDEPLALDSRARLVAPDGTLFVAMADGATWRTGGTPTFLTGFTLEDTLPPDTALSWELDAWTLGGGRAVAPPALRTPPAWLPLEDLGFEQGVDARVVGTFDHCAPSEERPRVARSVGSLTAIAGDASLLAPYGTRTAILLDPPAEATTLRLSVVQLSADGHMLNSLSLFVRTRRGESIPPEEQLWSDTGSATGDAVYPFAGLLQTLVFTLPTNATDLLLEINADCDPWSGMPAVGAAGWVDALEFE